MPVLQKLTDGLRVPVLIWTDDVDSKSIDQLRNVAKLPFVFHHVAAMPDVHAGMGATIGSVIATKGAIIPAAVGVDVGCGMLAVRTNLKKQELNNSQILKLFEEITSRVPLGFAQRNKDRIRTDLCQQFKEPLQEIVAREPHILDGLVRSDWQAQLGSLGSGNHFIEVCFDEQDCIWIMLHTGSRGIGNIMASYFILKAKEDSQARAEVLPDIQLAALFEGTGLFKSYMMSVDWSLRYAWQNRQVILEDVLDSLRCIHPETELTGEVINCHHNYVSQETHFGEKVWVTRKGAIRAGKGEKGIIPGNMGSHSFLVEGLGCELSFESCSHGAGRKMSRTEAKKRFSIEDLEDQTQKVVCRKDVGVIDEIPSAYKSIDTVMGNQTDLVKVLHTLSQLICVKG